LGLWRPLKSKRPISQKELGDTLLFEKSNVSKIVKILLERKWIRVTVATHDRRLTLLTETPESFAVWKERMHAFNQSSKVCEKLGPPNVLVNNAGIMLRCSFEEISFEDWDQTFRINLSGSFYRLTLSEQEKFI
jgi:DNA-binding MarR family transcriptional regulator